MGGDRGGSSICMKGRRWKKSKSSILFFIPVKKMIDRSFAFDGGERNGEDNKKKRRKGRKREPGEKKGFAF